jgi:hypothetical protein
VPIHNTTRIAQAQMVGNRCGILAFSQMPLIVGLASKNNVISCACFVRQPRPLKSWLTWVGLINDRPDGHLIREGISRTLLL